MLQTHAVYSDGTVDIATSARTAVTGTTTLWNTAVTGMGFNNVRVGGKMTFVGGTDVYTVGAVGSDTGITLVDRYIGTDALSGASYTYFEDEYALASDFARPLDVRQFSSAIDLPILGRQEFYQRFPRNSTTGRPQRCTLLELGPTTSVSPQPRILIHPAPDQVYNIPYRYITSHLAVTSAGSGAADLVNDTDEPIIPLRYRHLLIYYALYQWYRDRKDDARAQEANSDYVDLYKRVAGDTSAETGKASLRVVRRGGMVGPRRTGRYSTGTRFDELRD